ncbi:MAG TPA: glycoside hydrolase family 88 protein, partial [Chitinophagaceae bacterium]|nr:glycoside hydrolase family 88 protein [Chitinophagaceae bacterium]
MRKIVCLLFIACCSFIFSKKDKPTFYIIGDSTVRNGDGTGKDQQWGWGSFIADHFDTSKITIRNHAIGGRSSRTFITEGRWDSILVRLKKGDYVIMQFGHNDAGPLDDTARARGTIRGIGTESKEIYNPIRKQQETVHTYGYYMRKYIRDTKAKGAVAIVCSPIPRNDWKDGKVVRSTDSYSGWAKQVAKEEGAYFIDLNDLIATKYESLGAGAVKPFFPIDHTHTNKQGAELNARIVTEQLKQINPGKIKQFIAEPSLPSKKASLQAMRTANKYFMDKWPDAGKSIITNRERPSNIWTRGVYYEGLMALYNIDKKKEYYGYAVQWGEKHNWNQRNGITTRNADDQCCGQTYIDLYLIDKKEERIKNIKACIDNMVNSEKKDDWNWIDALQMAMPVFVRLGTVYNDTAYFRKMYDLYAFAKYNHGGNGLYNKADALWWRDKDFVPPYKEPNGEDCYWSRGNGWVLAALARTMQMLPKTDPHYNEYLQDFKDMAAAIVKLQRQDGFWNVSLHDPSHFGGKETSGTALFTYGFAWGVNHGILDKEIYLPAITKAWNAMLKDALHPDGKLGFVQGTGKEPKDGQPVGYDSIP